MWKSKPLLYIAGPLTSEGNAFENVRNAIAAGIYARQLGWAVIIPHLDYTVTMVTGDTNVSNYLDNDFNMLSRCDALLVLPYKIEQIDETTKSGTAQELDFAESEGIPIFTGDTLPSAVDFETREEEICQN